MLPLWRNQLKIAMMRDCLAVVHYKVGLRPRIISKNIISFSNQTGEPVWQAATKALAQFVNQWKGKATDVTLILSNEFVRYALIPWNEQLKDTEEEMAYARFSFNKTYGEIAQKWLLNITDEEPGKARVASGVDAQLIETIKAIFIAKDLRLISVQPLLMSAINFWHKEIQHADVWFLILEKERACLARIEKGSWHALRQTRLNTDKPEELFRFVERENRSFGLSNASLLLFAAALPKPSYTWQGWRIQHLVPAAQPNFSPLTDAQFNMVICA